MLKLEHFKLEAFNENNDNHQKLKEDIINMKDSKLISKDIDAYIKRNFDLGEKDNITRTYVIIHDEDYIGLSFVNYHPEEVINGKKYDEEIEIGLGILPEFRNQGFGSLVEKELSEKLLEIFPRFKFIVAKTDEENIASINTAKKAGFKHFKDDEYHYERTIINQ